MEFPERKKGNIRILIITNMYPNPKVPYSGIFVKEQADSLRRLGVGVDIFFINGKQSRLNYLYSIFRIRALLKKESYDIIHSHHSYCVLCTRLATLFLPSSTPLVFTLHEAEAYKPKKMKSVNEDFIRRLVYLKKIKKIALNIVDLVITVDDKLIKILDHGGRTVLLPCGIDLDLFRPMDKNKCREKLNLPTEKKIVFFPANPRRKTHKGYDILNKALNFINQKDIYLLTGGNIRHQDMPYYMCASDVVVQTSNFEASPMIIKEAMACNIPIVSTDVGDVSTIFGSTPGYFICRLEPRSVALCIIDALKFKERPRGRDKLQELDLSLEGVAQRLLNIYADLLNDDYLNVA
jgi:glycosyltransferase involved in cell wall biosynthesis